MLKRYLLLPVLCSIAFYSVPAHAAGSANRAKPAKTTAITFRVGAASYIDGAPYIPASPDNWLGGTGTWTTGSNWSAGRPNNGSDVFINTGNDYVFLNTSAQINSLTLGGSSGSSTLIDPSNGAHILYLNQGLTINQSGALTLGFDEVNAHANSSNAGTINLSNETGFNIHADFANSGTINLEANPKVIVSGTLNNTGNIVDVDDTSYVIANNGVINSGGIYVYSLQTFGNLNNAASGILNLQNLSVSANMVNQGLLQGYARGSQFLVSGELTNSGRFDLSYANATIGTLNNTGSINLGGTLTVLSDLQNSGGIGGSFLDVAQNITVNGTFTNAASGSLFLGTIGGTLGDLNNSGSVELENQGALTVRRTVINSGTIVSGSMAGNNILQVGKLTNNPGATLSLNGVGDIATVYNLVNTGTITVANGATLSVPPPSHSSGNALAGFLNAGSVLISQGATISSPSKYLQTAGQTTVDGHLSGQVNFAGGTVYGNGGTITGSVTSNASMNFGDAPMTVGQLTFAGNFTQGASGNLTFDIAGLHQYDQMSVTGQAHLGGMMTIDLLHGYVPQVGNIFELMTFSGSSGTFSNIVGLPINGQEHFTLQYNSNNLTLDVVAGALAGTSSIKLGATNNEPFIEIAEAGGVSQNTMDQGQFQTTPEPGSLVLFGTGAAGMMALIRRRMGHA